MRIGIAQIDTVAGEFSQTVERMVAQSQRAAERGVELLVFPLAALAGIEPVSLADRSSFMGDLAGALAELGARLACPALVPYPVNLGDRDGAFDVLLVDGSKVRPLLLPERLDKRGGEAGAQRPVQFSLGDVRLTLALSYADLDAIGEHSTDIVVFVSGYPFALDDPSSGMGANLEETRFAADAYAIGAWLVGVACVGCYGIEVFSGSSFVLSPHGELAALAEGFEESLLVADLALPAPKRLDDPAFPEPYDAPFHLWQALLLGIQGYASKNGFADVALCLDGSLGASVLAALASDALGPLHVHALVGASAGTAAPACRELARRLRIDARDATGHPQSLDVRDLDELELAALARDCGALVLSSADKTSLALGNRAQGLSAAALCPLGDVFRSDVLDMAHVRNTISPVFRRVVLGEADALDVAMPDGSTRVLSSERDISRVDEIIMGYVEYDYPRSELTEGNEQDGDLIDAVLRAIRTSEVWRRRMPPVLAMSTQTLDDAGFPVGVSWNDEHLDAMDDLLAGFDSMAAGEAGDLLLPVPASGSEEPHVQAPKHPTRADIDSTLAMLRDLAEQGGFTPTHLGDPTEGSDLGPYGQMLGWMTPFSEN